MSEFDMLKDTAHYQKTYLIPATLQPRVCMCLEPGGVLFDTNKRARVLNCCNKCLKPYRWNVRICTVCRKHFIKDFRKKSIDCVRHAKCWDCLELRGCTCDKEHTTRPDFGPLGLNPRVWTPEELADIKPPF